VIEDKIDYSQLDLCPKAVMDKLKNATNNDIKAILEIWSWKCIFN
jgi:hypothetical protein